MQDEQDLYTAELGKLLINSAVIEELLKTLLSTLLSLPRGSADALFPRASRAALEEKVEFLIDRGFRNYSPGPINPCDPDTSKIVASQWDSFASVLAEQRIARNDFVHGIGGLDVSTGKFTLHNRKGGKRAREYSLEDLRRWSDLSVKLPSAIYHLEQNIVRAHCNSPLLREVVWPIELEDVAYVL